MQTPRILDKIHKKVNDAKRRRRSNENPSLLYNITSSITHIDGEVPNEFVLEEFVKDLPMKDTNLLLDRISEVNAKIGVQLDIDAMCSECGRYYVVPFRIQPAFFRPSNI